jgi:hypothetical protein
MKILVSLIGLILFLSGIYLTYWVYLDFESFDSLYLALYLSGSFILMTLGFYLFLLPLALKPKNTNDILDKSLDQAPLEHHDNNSIVISNTDAIKIIQDNVKDISPVIKSEDIEENIFTENEVVDENIITQNLIKPLNDENLFSENTNESSQINKDEVFDIVELRVIGIESWSSQGILRKLTQDSHLEINQKIKSGITMNQVCFKQKLIGFIPRLDMNKIIHKLDRLVEITPSSIVKEGNKTIHFTINLKFKLEDKTNE